MEKLHITQPDHFALAVEQSISMSPACINFLPSKLRIQAVIKFSYEFNAFIVSVDEYVSFASN